MNQEQLDSLFGSVEIPDYPVKVEADSGEYGYCRVAYSEVQDVEDHAEDICLVPSNFRCSGVNGRSARYELSSFDGDDEFIMGHQFTSCGDTGLMDRSLLLGTSEEDAENLEYKRFSQLKESGVDFHRGESASFSNDHRVPLNGAPGSLPPRSKSNNVVKSRATGTAADKALLSKKSRKQKAPEKQPQNVHHMADGEKGGKKKASKKTGKGGSKKNRLVGGKRDKSKKNASRDSQGAEGTDLLQLHTEEISRMPVAETERTVGKDSGQGKSGKRRGKVKESKKKQSPSDFLENDVGNVPESSISTDRSGKQKGARKAKAAGPKAKKGKLSVRIPAKAKGSKTRDVKQLVQDVKHISVKSENQMSLSTIKKEVQEHIERGMPGCLSLIVRDGQGELEQDVDSYLADPNASLVQAQLDTENLSLTVEALHRAEGAGQLGEDSEASSDGGSKKPISCEYCGKRFALPGQMTVHLRRHSGVKPYKCKVCGRCFAESGDMRKHERIHTGEKPYSCPTCGKAFALAGNLAKHKLIHTNVRPFKCHYCDSAFRRAEGLKKHIQTHTGEKPFSCDVCQEKFARAGSLKEHYRRHTGEKPYGCEYCNQRYARSCDLDKHIRVHTNEKPYVCSVCNRGFKQSVVLRRHMRIHTGEKNYVCSECGKAFSLPGALKIHFRLHTNEKPYQCDICGKRFGNPSNRDTHQKVHVDGKKVCCDVCGKAFIDESVLEEHKKVHAEKKPYHCDKCDKSFTCPSQLEIHYRVHSNVRPFTCTLCNRAFKQKSTAETHLTKIHHLAKEKWTSHITQADIKRRFVSLSSL